MRQRHGNLLLTYLLTYNWFLMDKNCFTCVHFPNCRVLRATSSENDSDEDRTAFLENYGSSCTFIMGDIE
jgi:hypothetical protein